MKDNKRRLAYVEELIKYHFCDSLQSGYLAYRDDCKDYFLNNLVELEKTKDELCTAIADPNYNWKELMRRNEFFQFQEVKTEEELLLDLKVLCWEVFFPEEILNKKEESFLKNEIHKFLKENHNDSNYKLEFAEIILRIQENDLLKNKEIGKYNLKRLFYDPVIFNGGEKFLGFYRQVDAHLEMCAEVGDELLQLSHELGTDFWYVSCANTINPKTKETDTNEWSYDYEIYTIPDRMEIDFYFQKIKEKYRLKFLNTLVFEWKTIKESETLSQAKNIEIPRMLGFSLFEIKPSKKIEAFNRKREKEKNIALERGDKWLEDADFAYQYGLIPDLKEYHFLLNDGKKAFFLATGLIVNKISSRG